MCADGSPLDEDTDVAPINLTLHSLFSQVDVSLNDQLVTSSKATYPYRAYMETLLSYGQEAKATQLSCEQWYKDTSGHMDTTQGTDNKAFVKRKLKAGNSGIIDMSGKLHIDLMFGERYILSGVNTVIQLVRSSDAFVLMADGPNPNYKMIVTEAILTVRKVTLTLRAPAVYFNQFQYNHQGPQSRSGQVNLLASRDFRPYPADPKKT